MSIYDGTVQYNLDRPVKYSNQGSSITGNFIELREPGMEHCKEALKLRQIISRAQMEFAQKAQQLVEFAEEQVVAGEEVKQFHDQAKTIEESSKENEEMIDIALMASTVVDVSEFITIFQKMACKIMRRSVCVIDGTQPMTPGIWGELHPDDAWGMAVKWCSFFAMPSSGGDKKESGQQQELVTPPTGALATATRV